MRQLTRSMTVLLCLLAVFGVGHNAYATTSAGGHTLRAGTGLAQQDAFWAERAPMVPIWALHYEGKLPFVFFENTIWESPLRVMGGVHGYQEWHHGTTEIGSTSSQLNGELGLAAGPSYKGSIFVLGTDLVFLSYAGAEFVTLAVNDSQRSYVNGMAGFGMGPGIYAGFQNFFLRQELVLGFGNTGYQHQLRWGFGLAF